MYFCLVETRELYTAFWFLQLIFFFQVKTEGALNASVSFIAKANPLNRPPNKRKSELQHALCNMLSSILAPLAEGGKKHWPPLGVDSALSLWYDAITRIRVGLMYWMDKQSKHIAVSYILYILCLLFCCCCCSLRKALKMVILFAKEIVILSVSLELDK